MKNKIIITLIVIISILGFSCNKSEESKMSIVEGVYDNLHAPEGGDFVKLKFIVGDTPATITDSEKNWDIAFRGTMIIVNGGVKTGSGNEPERLQNLGGLSAFIDILNKNYDAVSESPYLKSVDNWDKAGQPKIPNISGQGWFEDDGTYITPLKDKTIVLKTIDNYYVKIGMYSYYKDALPETTDDPAYYSFKYSFNPNYGISTLDD